MPKPLSHVALIALAVLCVGKAPVAAQTSAPPDASATIAGRVTEDEDTALHGVAIALLSSDPTKRFKVLARATTDGDGRYRLSNIKPGRYQVALLAAAYVLPDLQNSYPPGKSVMVAAGESFEDLDFKLVRGGVITGRITDADGQPVIQEMVHLSVVDTNRSGNIGVIEPYRHLTDDRGVYRIYGLPAGSYRVSVGQDRERGFVRPGSNRSYQRVFYPGTTKESKATAVEVRPGVEATDIDITLGKPAKSFRASGRVVNAETGQPVPNLRLGYSVLIANEPKVSRVDNTMSNARGEFRLDNLTPGRYAVFASNNDEATEWYSDSAPFEIRDSEASGLEVRIRRGASISGVVVVEGARDRAAIARLLPQVVLSVANEARNKPAPPIHSPVKPAPDGSFRVGGLRPGRAQFYTGWPPVKGLTLLRLEHNGAEQREGIEVAEGSQVTGARIIFAYGDATIRGQVHIVGGALPPQSRLYVFIQRAGGSQHFVGRGANVDARGRFIVEGLPAGDYELVAQASGLGMRHRDVRQRITLDADGETNVTLTLDLSEGNNGSTP